MNTLLIMSLSSSILLLMLMIIERFRPDIFSQKCRYYILRIALLLLIVPLPLVKVFMQEKISEHILNQEGPSGFLFSGTQPIVLYADGVAYENTAYQISSLLKNICLGIAIIFILYYLIQYMRSRKKILNTFYECQDSEVLHILKEFKSGMKIRRNVRIYTTDLQISPFTIGVRKPVIVIPQLADRSQKEMVICHELCHIKNFDGLFKFLYIVLAGAYWYNPLTYLLGEYLDTASEMLCDEAVTKHMDKIQRRKYGNLVIDMACYSDECPNPVLLPLSKDKQNIKERVRLIMKDKHKTSFVMVMLSIIMVICSTSAVFAYKPVNIVKIEPLLDGMETSVEANSIVGFAEGETLLFDLGFEEVKFDSQFTDMDGNIYKVEDVHGDRVNCVHNYVDGRYQNHIKYGDGSCEINLYTAKICKKCSTVVLQSLINSLKSLKCMH